jgi:Ca2+-dependent lipid-binding protein
MPEKDPFFENPKPLGERKEEQEVQDINEWWKELPLSLQAFAKDLTVTTTTQYEGIAKIVDSFYVMEHVATSSIVVMTMSLSIFVTYWRLGWAWYIVILSVMSTFYFKNVERYKRKIRNQAWIEFSKYEMDGDLETVNWFNSFLTKYWVNYEPGLSESIKNTVDLSLDFYKPAALEELRLTTFTLGSQAPRINSIKTYPNTDSETLVMDWDLAFTPVDSDNLSKEEMLLKDIRNVEIVLLAKVGLVPLQVMVKEFFLAGKMRIQLKFMTGYPHIKVVDIAFLTKPDVDFILKPLGAMDINKFGGLGDFIKETVQSQLAALMVNPVKMTFPIGEWMGAAAAGATETPIGVLRVAIFEGKGIKNVDMTGVSDPMVRILIGGSEAARTRVIDNTLDPKWNEVHHIIIYKSTMTQVQSGSDEFKIEVSHSNALSSKPLGNTVSLSLSRWIKLLGVPDSVSPDEGVSPPLTREEQEEMLLDWGSPFNDHGSVWKKLALDKRASGTVRLGLCFFPMAPNTLQTPPASPPDEGAAPKPVAEPVTGIVTATIHQAKELQVSENSAIDCAGYSDTKELFKTGLRKRTANPSWETRHMFYCSDIGKDELRLVLYNKGQVVGEVKVNIKDAMKGTDDWYKIFGRGTGKLRVSFKFAPVDIKQTTADKTKASRLDPVGIMKVFVREAKNLANVEMMGKSDPYVKVLLSGRAVGATNVQDNTLSPQWNETFYTVAYSMKETITFEVLDWNNLAKDRPLGKIHLPIGPLMSYLKGGPSGAESNQLGEFELDGLKVTVQDKTIQVCAPLYFKEEKVEEDKSKVGDQLEVPSMPTRSTTFFKKGISNLGSEIRSKKVKQKGHIYFDLNLFEVIKENIIEPTDYDESEQTQFPEIAVKDEDKKNADALQIVTKRKPNADIVKECSMSV